MLDKLRVCIICNFYSQSGRLTQAEYINHPAIKSLKCEHLDMAIAHARCLETSVNASGVEERSFVEPNEEYMSQSAGPDVTSAYTQQYEVKICVGNVSKYLSGGESSGEANQKQPTHKWMVYLRSPQCSRFESYIKKVLFFLHSSYKPNDIVELKYA